MEPVIIPFTTEAEWLEARKQDITSTEAAALFGVSPYTTVFELHHRKAGTVKTLDLGNDNQRMKWGNRLEAPIALGVAEDLGLIVEPFKVYIRVPELRIGSSFDYKVVGLVEGFQGDETARNMFREHGPGIMEVKNVDGLAFKRGWIDGEDGIEAPPHIEFQVQHQLHVANMAWSIIAPLVGGNTPKVVIRNRDQQIGAAIVAKAKEFWARVDAGTPPEPDYIRDSGTIKSLYVENDGSEIDLSDDERLAELCRAYKAAAADAKAAEERKKAAHAEILTIVQSAKSIKAEGFKISAGTNKETFRVYDREAGERWTITKSVIPAAHVESTVPAFRNVRITETA